jgi:DNA-directed RNA polymerase subunit N (RpoN/RPB10)
MMLQCGSQGAGRPEEIVDELGLDVERYSIRRTRLIWGEEPEQ